MSYRVLITGVNGFLGRHLCRYLKAQEEVVEIWGVDIGGEKGDCSEFFAGDIVDEKMMAGLIRQMNPTHIIHLAGTFGTNLVQDIYRINVLSMSALLEAVKNYGQGVVIVATGSAAEYGFVTSDNLPVQENTPCLPAMPYGISKLLATQLALHYQRLYNVNITLVRPFQLIGPGISERLAPGAFASQIKQVIKNGSGEVKVGNLQSSRDFLDVVDAVHALWVLCQKPAPGEIFNLCSGYPTKMFDLLHSMIAASGRDLEVTVDTNRLRPESDVSIIYGSYQKLKNHCGWRPNVELKDSVCHLLGNNIYTE